MSMGQLGQMSFAGSSTNLTQNIHGKIIKDGSQDLESHHHLSHHQQHDSSQESIDESTHASHHLQHHIVSIFFKVVKYFILCNVFVETRS